MIKSMLRFFGIVKGTREPDKYEPIYGLTKRSLDEWLSHNPILKQEYESKLRAYNLR